VVLGAGAVSAPSTEACRRRGRPPPRRADIPSALRKKARRKRRGRDASTITRDVAAVPLSTSTAPAATSTRCVGSCGRGPDQPCADSVERAPRPCESEWSARQAGPSSTLSSTLVGLGKALPRGGKEAHDAVLLARQRRPGAHRRSWAHPSHASPRASGRGRRAQAAKAAEHDEGGQPSSSWLDKAQLADSCRSTYCRMPPCL
jgi:hypothetical protein